MAKIFRITWSFDEPKQGWSESWYFQRDAALLKDLLDEFEQLGDLRAKLLGKNAALTHVRVSQVVDTVTGVRTPRVSLPRDTNKQSGSSQKLCAPHDSLLVQCVTGDQVHRKPAYLGGVWMTCFDELRHYNPPEAFLTNFNNWAAEVKARGLGWLAQKKDVFADINGYTVDPDSGLCTYVLSEPITFAGDPKRRRVLVDFPGGHEILDGVQIVGPVTGLANNAITVKPRRAKPFAGVKGSMKTYTFDLVTLGPIATGQAPSLVEGQRMARRNRGKALYAEVGRRSAIPRG